MISDTGVAGVCQLVLPLKCNDMLQKCENFRATTGHGLIHFQDTTVDLHGQANHATMTGYGCFTPSWANAAERLSCPIHLRLFRASDTSCCARAADWHCFVRRFQQNNCCPGRRTGLGQREDSVKDLCRATRANAARQVLLTFNQLYARVPKTCSHRWTPQSKNIAFTPCKMA